MNPAAQENPEEKRFVIRIISAAGGQPVEGSGCYVNAYDPDGDRGFGRCFVAQDPDAAMMFASEDEARAYYMQISEDYPKRPDGEPNRPLTKYTIEIQTLAEARAQFAEKEGSP